MNKIITIRDIAQNVKWKEVKRAIKYFYPTDKNNYEVVFERLQKIRKRKPKDLKELVVIYGTFDINDDLQFNTIEEQYNEVYYHIVTNKYSMSFRKWAELSNIPIAEETLKHHTPTDILAHFIWEITYYGSETQSVNQGERLQKIVKDVRKQIKDKS